MNYLGHLYFSKNNHTLMLGNLIGDFVKGKNFRGIPENLHEGIILHRRIDNFTDHHPAVIQLQKNIQNELPKVSGIAIDLVFDHLLAINWNKFHTQNFDEFLNDFYQFVAEYKAILPQKVRLFLENLLTYRFINQYDKMLFLESSGAHLSQKISFPNTLSTTAEVFSKNKPLFESSFRAFMGDAMVEFNQISEKDY